MKRMLVVLTLGLFLLAANPMAAEASVRNCRFALYGGYSECIEIIGSGLHVDRVDGEFMGKDQGYVNGYIKHRLCIDTPPIGVGTNTCHWSPVFYVACYNDISICHQYSFPQVSNTWWPHGTSMCTYTYSSAGTKLSGPACGKILS